MNQSTIYHISILTHYLKPDQAHYDSIENEVNHLEPHNYLEEPILNPIRLKKIEHFLIDNFI